MADLDHAVEPDHLTSLYVPELGAPISREVARFADLAVELRRRCPWDKEQITSRCEAICWRRLRSSRGPRCGGPANLTGYEELEEELGDLLYQIVFHSVLLAAEAGQFTLADVAQGIHDKLKSRHPHVRSAA